MLTVAFRRLAAVVLALLLVTLPVAAQRPDYSRARSHLPNVFSPYTPRFVPQPDLANSPRIENLIRDGKLYLSLQDAIYLALENNLDIAVARYGPDVAATEELRARGGGITRGTGVQTGGAGLLPTLAPLGVGALAQLDPQVQVNFIWRRNTQPTTNPFLAGTGLFALIPLVTNLTQANFSYTQGFMTGTSFQVTWNNNRFTSTSPAALFNPALNTQLQFGFRQSLLNGFGYAQNKRFILVSKNNKQLSDQSFLQQVMDIISNVKNAYWELVFAREDVKVKEQSLALAEKLYQDNRRQVEIGTLAPIEVVRAEAEVARGRQDLIVSQTTLLQQQITMKDLIAKNPMDPLLALIEIIPTDTGEVPPLPEILPIQDALQIAMEKRPEVIQAQLNTKNAELAVQASRNAMLPTADLFAFYGGNGVGGLGPLVPEFTGYARALTRALQGEFPDYGFGLNLTIPIKNRVAQADTARAQIEERQSQVRYQRTVNQVIREVRNAQIALEQSWARIEAAEKARLLAQETLNAEEKKLQLGASTIFLVIQAQRDLTSALSQEVRARVDFQRAQVNFDRALGRTLERSQITVEGAQSGMATAGLGRLEGDLLRRNSH